jgi:TolB-like protein/Flp pilus assembly protein TadD
MSGQPAKGLWNQLKKRKVVRFALMYIVVAWIVFLVGNMVFENLAVPAWSLSLLAGLVLLGFPAALVLAWIYEITPKGIRRDSAGYIESVIGIEDRQGKFPSIAVLRFDDISEKGNQGYFCEGIAEEILNDLGRFAGLRVVPRVTSFQIDNTQADAREVGKKLDVQTVLQGSVCKTGKKLHVSAQLIGSQDACHLWSGQYDRHLEEAFEVQEEITNSIAKVLCDPLAQKREVARQHVDPGAYDFLLRGLSYFSRHTTQDNMYARQMLKQAIDIEPNYGRAWAGVAYTYGFDYMYFNASDVNLLEAKRSSDRALKLAPDLAQSHVASGIACCMSQDYSKAEKEFGKAIQLNPKNYQAWYFFGRAKVHEGNLERALKLFERASRVRTEDFQSVLLQAQLYTSLDEKGKALEVTREGIKRVRAVLDLNPNDNRALNMGAFALLRLGKAEEAVKWMQASLKNAPMDSIIQYNGACFFSLAGDVDRALDCLENCLIKVGNISREWLLHDSDMDNIRYHSRFEEITSTFPE